MSAKNTFAILHPQYESEALKYPVTGLNFLANLHNIQDIDPDADPDKKFRLEEWFKYLLATDPYLPLIYAKQPQFQGDRDKLVKTLVKLTPLNRVIGYTKSGGNPKITVYQL